MTMLRISQLFFKWPDKDELFSGQKLESRMQDEVFLLQFHSRPILDPTVDLHRQYLVQKLEGYHQKSLWRDKMHLSKSTQEPVT